MAAMIPECDIPECGPDPGRGEERRGLSAETHNGQSVAWLSLAGTDTVMFVQLNDLKRESLFGMTPNYLFYLLWGNILYT